MKSIRPPIRNCGHAVKDCMIMLPTYAFEGTKEKFMFITYRHYCKPIGVMNKIIDKHSIFNWLKERYT